MQKTLATVNINMGLGKDNPALIITPTTDIPLLVSNFISSYQLPHSAYEVIISAIQRQLTNQNVFAGDISRDSYGREDRPVRRVQEKYQKAERERRPIPIMEIRNKKQPVSWDQLKMKKQFPINRIEFQRKGASPGYLDRQKLQNQKQNPKLTKITLTRAKSPILKRDKSAFDTKRTKSPIQNRTPLKQRQLTQQPRVKSHITEAAQQLQMLSQVFNALTRNQPKTIKVLSPEYVSFNGIKPEALAVLQQFFEHVEQHQFMNMDKQYFMARMRQLNLVSQIMEALHS